MAEQADEKPEHDPAEAEQPAAEPAEAAEAETAQPDADPAADAGTDDAPEAAAGAEEGAADAEEVAADAEEAPSAPPQTPDRGEPAEQLSPKERRRRARSRHTSAKPPRSPQERHAERQEERRRKAERRRVRRAQERAKAAASKAADGGPTGERELAPVHAAVRGARRMRQGVVVSDKAEKTITVRIDVARRHRRYEKIVRSSSTVHAHDENNEAHEGDVVRVIESRPLSRTKRWALVDVLERAR
jgi:small subunit ribosomal protein S17